MEIVRVVEPTNGDVIEAIRIRTSECFGALNIANALGGEETASWYLIHHYTLEQLKEEAQRRGLVFTEERAVLNGEVWAVKG